MKAVRQDMLEESSDEFHGMERHAAGDSGIGHPVVERDRRFPHIFNAIVGKGYPVNIGSQIS
jgi:hypothetical protein